MTKTLEHLKKLELRILDINEKLKDVSCPDEQASFIAMRELYHISHREARRRHYEERYRRYEESMR